MEAGVNEGVIVRGVVVEEVVGFVEDETVLLLVLVGFEAVLEVGGSHGSEFHASTRRMED